MKKVFLITPQSKKIPICEDADYIGVDAGVLLLLKQGIQPVLAVGDFDSMDEEQFNHIESICPIIKHPIMKDEPDSELAVRVAYERGYETVILYGGLSNRIDHTIANLRLLMYKYPSLILMDDKQKLTNLSQGTYEIDQEYSHISFFAIETSIITLEDFLYPLTHRTLYKDDIYTLSNSLEQEKARIIVEKGCVLCVQSSYE